VAAGFAQAFPSVLLEGIRACLETELHLSQSFYPVHRLVAQEIARMKKRVLQGR